MISPTTTYPADVGVLRPRHLLDVDSLTGTEIGLIFDEAERTADATDVPLQGKTVINFFAEASTRTRISFEIAAGRLGAQVVNIAAGGSSLEKGESLVDTVRTFQSVGAHALVIRHA
nr:aspartate carbamoyltransferase [Chloroflexota bacterium]